MLLFSSVPRAGLQTVLLMSPDLPIRHSRVMRTQAEWIQSFSSIPRESRSMCRAWSVKQGDVARYSPIILSMESQ